MLFGVMFAMLRVVLVVVSLLIILIVGVVTLTLWIALTLAVAIVIMALPLRVAGHCEGLRKDCRYVSDPSPVMAC